MNKILIQVYLLLFFASAGDLLAGESQPAASFLEMQSKDTRLVILHGKIETFGGSANYFIRLRVNEIYPIHGKKQKPKLLDVYMNSSQMNKRLSAYHKEQRDVLLIVRKDTNNGKERFTTPNNLTIDNYMTEATASALALCRKGAVRIK